MKTELTIKQKTKLIKALSKAMKASKECCVTLDTYNSIKEKLTSIVESI